VLSSKELGMAGDGKRFATFACDVSLASARKSLVQSVASWAGKDGLSLLVNNHGTNIRLPTQDYTPEQVHLLPNL